MRFHVQALRMGCIIEIFICNTFERAVEGMKQKMMVNMLTMFITSGLFNPRSPVANEDPLFI